MQDSLSERTTTMANTTSYDDEGYDQNGFDRDGFDRDGFTRYGFDEDGYDRDGFNRHGFNRDGFDHDGFDRYGFDDEGYDRKGYDQNGFDRYGFDDEGFDRRGNKRMGASRREPGMSRYDWSAIDNKYKWVAKDSNGRVEAYRERPILGESCWYSNVGSQQLGYSPPWESDSDWQESLEERPKPAKRYELIESGLILDRKADNWLDLVEVVDRLNEYEEGKA